MNKANILVVEDETIVAKDIEHRLKQMGYVVPAVACSGEQAVLEAEEIRPDLVLMDIMLKGRMDGVEAARRINERFDIPVIYLTAYSDDQTLQRAETTQPFGYLLKPFGERELRTNIQMALYKHKLERQLKESQQWFSTTLRCISDAVIATDKRGFITFINPVAQMLTGWKEEDALGKDLTKVFHIVHEEMRTVIQSPVAQVLRKGSDVGPTRHSVLIAKDGTETPIEESVSPIKDEKGSILGVVLVFRDISQRKEQEAAQEYQALHDTLTGLPNRNLFYDRLQQVIFIGYRSGHPVALFFISLANFKEINQEMGRYIGDQLLQQAGQRLWDSVRRSDTVARISGSDFAVVVSGAGMAEHVTLVAQKLLGVMTSPFMVEGKSIHLPLWVGVALFPKHGEDPDTLIHQAYVAMKMAKRSGKAYALYRPEGIVKKKGHGLPSFIRRPQSRFRFKNHH